LKQAQEICWRRLSDSPLYPSGHAIESVSPDPFHLLAAWSTAWAFAPLTASRNGRAAAGAATRPSSVARVVTLGPYIACLRTVVRADQRTVECHPEESPLWHESRSGSSYPASHPCFLKNAVPRVPLLPMHLSRVSNLLESELPNDKQSSQLALNRRSAH
jgi:hypothetical protein